MKKLLAIAPFFLCSLFSMKFLQCNPPPLLETKGGYFFFASDKIRTVYPSGGFEFEISGSYPVWKFLHIYGSLGFLEAWGHSKNFHQSTTLWEIPIDIGLKPIFTLTSFLDYYFALGPRYFYAHQHNNSSYVDRNIGQSGIGLFANTGLNFIFKKHLLIDFFGEYAYEPTTFSPSDSNVYSQSVQLSKFTFGTGIGFAF